MKPAPDGAGAQHLTPNERAAKGKAAREANPRAGHAAWSASQRTLRPMSLLLEQEETRVPELVPIRHGRMATSPFAYFRGAALPMAADLVTTSQSGLRVQLCGDAHLSNFGGFASPERELIFDVNDFDETAPGPFEWDVKRLAASLEVAGRALEFDDDARQKTVLRGVRTYREAMRRFAQMPRLDIWYAKLDMPTILALWGSDAGAGALKRLQRASGKAESKDHLKARDKLTGMKDGELRFLSDPPLLVPIEELYNRPDEAAQVEAVVHGALRSYRRTLAKDRRQLLNEYRFVDLARKVVGVGSVGTRCWVALFVGRDESDPLMLQVKEAEASVLERFSGKSDASNHGQRVVEGQHLMQSASDIFLGWHRVEAPDGTRDFYMRQLWDWKASAAVETMTPDLLGTYASMCAWTLARAHARSGDPIAIGAYLGSSKVFDRALAEFAGAYADQNDDDFEIFTRAIKDGSLESEMGI